MVAHRRKLFYKPPQALRSPRESKVRAHANFHDGFSNWWQLRRYIFLTFQVVSNRFRINELITASGKMNTGCTFFLLTVDFLYQISKSTLNIIPTPTLSPCGYEKPPSWQCHGVWLFGYENMSWTSSPPRVRSLAGPAATNNPNKHHCQKRPVNNSWWGYPCMCKRSSLIFL